VLLMLTRKHLRRLQLDFESGGLFSFGKNASIRGPPFLRNFLDF